MATAETLQDLARSHIDVQSKGKGGNTKFICNHCGKQYTGSLTRQLAHLTGESGSGIAGCSEILTDLREGIKIEQRSLQRSGQSGSKRSSSQLVNSGISESYYILAVKFVVKNCECHHVVFAGSTDERPAKRLRQPTIAETLADKRATDLVVAEFFYGTGIPLHLVRQVKQSLHRHKLDLCNEIAEL